MSDYEEHDSVGADLDSAIGFLSYAHVDDEAEGGRIRRLATKIQAEYRLLTGEQLEIFVDRADIRWGQEWQARIDAALQETTFFIPVLTNSYFLSDACRKEFLDFHNWAKSLGVSQYLLALRYGPVRDLNSASKDAARAIAAATQFKPWEHLRLLDEESAEYRLAVNDLALELERLTAEVAAKPASDALGGGEQKPEATTAGGGGAATYESDGLSDLKHRNSELHVVEGAPAPAPALKHELGGEQSLPFQESLDVVDPYGDDPSPLELAAELEPRMQEWNGIMTDFLPILNRFNDIIVRSAERTGAVTGGNIFAQRLGILREAAEEIGPVAAQIEDQGRAYMNALLGLDPAYKAIIEMVRLSGELSDEDLDGLRSLSESVDGMAFAARESREQMLTAIAAGRNLARASRDLRPSIKRYETGVQNVVDGQSVIDSWSGALRELVDERRGAGA